MSRFRLIFWVVSMFSLAFGLRFSVAIHGQTLSSTAALSGTVSDPSGARVQQATVKLTNSQQGITRVSTAGAAGEFSFALLPAGTYTLEANASGVKTTRHTGIVFNAGDSLTENVQLTIG